MSQQVINNTISVGALSNATRPLFPAPSAGRGGGISVLDASVVQGGSTNSSLRLVKGTISAGGTFTVTGTLDAAALGGTGSPFAANVVQRSTISAGWVAADEWLALVEGNVAAANAVAYVNIAYVMGRASQ